MYDFHIHSTLSFDGHESIGAMCAQALALGLREICFCEHVEIGHIYPADRNGLLDFPEYARQIDAARARFPALGIRMGAEAGLSLGGLAQTAAYIRALPLDFVIASQHTAEGRDPYSDKTYFEGRSVKEAIGAFLLETRECLRGCDAFDVIGHLSFISLFAPRPKPLEFSDHPELLDAILRDAAARGKGIEVNTTGYYVYGAPLGSLSVLKRFRELGGEIVTIGSDAHFTQAVGHEYEKAARIVRAAGFPYVCTFKNRKPIFNRF